MAQAESKAYPTTAMIKRVMDAARTCGLDVAGCEVGPGGIIRVFEARAEPQKGNAFDRFADQL